MVFSWDNAVPSSFPNFCHSDNDLASQERRSADLGWWGRTNRQASSDGSLGNPHALKPKVEDEEKRGFRLESGDKRGKWFDNCLVVNI